MVFGITVASIIALVVIVRKNLLEIQYGHVDTWVRIIFLTLVLGGCIVELSNN